MKLHYFDQEKADENDFLLKMTIQQGYVPASCLLAGHVVMRLVTEQGDPCKGCEGPRDKCHGRPKQEAPADARHGRRSCGDETWPIRS
jgi:hypothetical protein